MAMQNNSFSVLFFIKKSKLLKNGEPRYCITVNSKALKYKSNGVWNRTNGTT